MTTIVYHRDTNAIAVDSRESADIILSDSVNKVIIKGDLNFILAGKTSCINALVESYPELPEYCSPVQGFVIKNGVAYSIIANTGELSVIKCSYNIAHGSGRNWALAAMDFGKDATEAIKYAMTRDLKTGGTVNTIKLGDTYA